MFEFQSLCTVFEDLHLLNRRVYFWHWNKEPMGVVCRLDSRMFAYFKDSQSEEELLKSLHMEKHTNGAVEIPAEH